MDRRHRLNRYLGLLVVKQRRRREGTKFEMRERQGFVFSCDVSSFFLINNNKWVLLRFKFEFEFGRFMRS